MHDDEYYKALGFKCGLEIHQRLATKHKLFCSCSATMKEEPALAKLERRQRAVAGELGKFDPSTSFESRKGRRFLYNIFKDTTCLVDIDEEPPHQLDEEALAFALEIASTFNTKVPDEIEPMRKEVVDGSDPSAFQRSMLIGYDGTVGIGGKSVPISSIFLEEESSGIEANTHEYVEYNVDRLGVPLIEIDTDPVIYSPKDAKEIALRIGMLLRLTGRVQRGIGSIRQDVNVSIREGTRVEIKGFQDIETMDVVIENEIERQRNLVDIKKELEKREAVVGKPVDVSGLFSDTQVKILRENAKNGGAVYAAKLTNFGGIVGREINPDRRLGSEMSDYAKMAGVKGLIHSDEDLKAYGFSGGELEGLHKELGMGKQDAFLMVSGPREICHRAIGLALKRAELSLDGVVPETRGIDSRRLVTKFLRPLPGGSRMYPETDTAPIEVDQQRFGQHLTRKVDYESVKKKLEDEIGNKQLADQMIRSPKLGLYNAVIEETDAAPPVVAAILLEKMKDIKRSGIEVDSINDETVIGVFERFANKEITKAAIEEILKALPKNPSEIGRIVREKRLERLSETQIEAIVKEMNMADRGQLMKTIMTKYRLNIDGEELNRVLSSMLSNMK